MLSFERKWAERVLEAFAPPGPNDRFAPSPGQVQYGASLLAMNRASNRFASVGMRLAVWAVFFAPVWLFGRLATFASLDIEQRAEILDRMLAHRFYLVREMVLLLKLAACMAIFALPDLRARSGYDRPVDHRPEESIEQSGERVRLDVVHEHPEEEVA
jgi:hypothetical protein